MKIIFFFIISIFLFNTLIFAVAKKAKKIIPLKKAKIRKKAGVSSKKHFFTGRFRKKKLTKKSYEYKNKWNVSITGTNLKIKDIYWNNEKAGTTDFPFAGMEGSEIIYFGSLGYTFYNGWRTELSLSQWRNNSQKSNWDKNIDVSGRYLFDTEISNYDSVGVTGISFKHYLRPIEFNIVYVNSNKSSKLKTFTGFVFGSYKNDVHFNYNTVNDTLISFNKRKSVPMYGFTGGMDYFLAKNIAIRFKAKYLWGGLDLFANYDEFFVNESLTGTSIPKEDMHKIIDRFNDADSRLILDNFQIEIGLSLFF